MFHYKRIIIIFNIELLCITFSHIYSPSWIIISNSKVIEELKKLEIKIDIDKYLDDNFNNNIKYNETIK